jgi:hypothetical protein
VLSGLLERLLIWNGRVRAPLPLLGPTTITGLVFWELGARTGLTLGLITPCHQSDADPVYYVPAGPRFSGNLCPVHVSLFLNLPPSDLFSIRARRSHRSSEYFDVDLEQGSPLTTAHYSMAKLAEQAERYEEMVESMKSVARVRTCSLFCSVRDVLLNRALQRCSARPGTLRRGAQSPVRSIQEHHCTYSPSFRGRSR